MFPREKGRFALQNGVETYPPSMFQCAPQDMSIKQLKEAAAKAGIVDQTKGFNEKKEYVDLLVAYHASKPHS